MELPGALAQNADSGDPKISEISASNVGGPLRFESYREDVD